MVEGGREAAADARAAPDDARAEIGVSLMITRRQRAALRALGIAEEAIHQMTPAQAHEILARHDAKI